MISSLFLEDGCEAKQAPQQLALVIVLGSLSREEKEREGAKIQLSHWGWSSSWMVSGVLLWQLLPSGPANGQVQRRAVKHWFKSLFKCLAGQSAC